MLMLIRSSQRAQADHFPEQVNHFCDILQVIGQRLVTLGLKYIMDGADTLKCIAPLFF